MQILIVSMVTILTCSILSASGAMYRHRPGYKISDLLRRQVRQLRPIQPHPSACYNNPCQNGATCEWMDVPMTCDCAVGFKGSLCEININECASNPCANNGYQTRCVDYINGYECECPFGYGGSECATQLNECDSSPCQHGGRCTDRFNGFSCSCSRGFAGTMCEININECASFPCLNQGVCIDSENSFFCDCKQGFRGNRCEHQLGNPGCSSMPCRNGGRCVNRNGGFQCNCPRGFHGRTCTQVVYTVTSKCHSFPCMNGGRCVERRHGYLCQCQSGFVGVNCQIEVNECARFPCENGGRCTDLVNGYYCSCPSGFIGKRCERALKMCRDSNCMNGGTCESDQEFTYCVCSDGYSGRICQYHIKDYTLRLVNGKSNYEGRVEVFYRKKWGPIADSKWTLQDAHVVCHHLGYNSASEAFGYSEYGHSYSPAHVCETVCTGNEIVIQDCVLQQPTAAGCTHKSHVGVKCSEVPSSCPTPWRSWGSSCYYIDPNPHTWGEAKQICVQKGARMVVIESEKENEFIREYLEMNHGGSPAAWIGLTDIGREGSWAWLGNKNHSFTNWNLGEPNNGGITSNIWTGNSRTRSTYGQRTNEQDCVEILTVNGKWNDIECMMKRPTVCETVQESLPLVSKMTPGLITVIIIIVIVFIVGGVITAKLILT